MEVIDESSMDEAGLTIMREELMHVTSAVKQKLGRKPSTPVNILKVLWTTDLFSMLIENFQQYEWGLDEAPTYIMWAKFLTFLLKNVSSIVHLSVSFMNSVRF